MLLFLKLLPGKDKLFFKDIYWSNVVVDGADRLKNEETSLYKVLVETDSQHRLLLTGASGGNYFKELWCLLNYLHVPKIEDWEAFKDKYGKPDGYDGLPKFIKPYITLIRRLKKDIVKSNFI